MWRAGAAEVKTQGLGLAVWRFTSELKRSVFVFGCGLAAFALVSLSYWINHPEDLGSQAGTLLRVASDAASSIDSSFTHRSQGLIGAAVDAKSRAAAPQSALEHAWTALEPENGIDRSLRSQGPASAHRDSTEGQVLPLKP